MCPSFSSVTQREGRLPQPLHIEHRGDAKEAFVLPIEVGGILVAHARGRYFSVEVLAQHQTTGLLQPEALLELQEAQRRDGLKWWCKAETLMPNSRARSSMRNGWSKFLRSCTTALAMWVV